MKPSSTIRMFASFGAAITCFLAIYFLREGTTGVEIPRVALPTQQSSVGEVFTSGASNIELPERAPVQQDEATATLNTMAPFQLHALDMNYPDPQKEMEAELTSLRMEVNRLRTRNRELEVRLSLNEGQVRRWLATLSPVQRQPQAETLVMMAQMLQDYPVELTYEEGMWMVERIEKDDWSFFGRTIDVAIFKYLERHLLSMVAEGKLTAKKFEEIKQEAML